MMSNGIRYEGFSCCHFCGIPQAICEQWEQKEEQGWWKEREVGRCQYQGVLIRAVATMLGEGLDEVVEDVYGWIEGYDVDIRDEKMIYKWFGQRV
jgi:hypothetical protein